MVVGTIWAHTDRQLDQVMTLRPDLDRDTSTRKAPMNLTVIFGSMALVGSVGVLWWGLTARPHAARANLFAGLERLETISAPVVVVAAPARPGHAPAPSPAARRRSRGQPRPGRASVRARSRPHPRDQGRARRVHGVAAGARRPSGVRDRGRRAGVLPPRLLGAEHPRQAAGRRCRPMPPTSSTS